MKRLLLILLCTIQCTVCLNAQNVKYLELSQESMFTPSPVGEEWRDVDSIVVTGVLGSKNYNQLRVLAEYFNLTGLNMANCRIVNDSIDQMAFKPFNVCLCIPGPGEYNYGYKSIKTEERYFRVNLKHISLPQTLEKIGEGAFYWNNLESLDIPGSVKTIDDKAFSGCKYLKSVYLHVSSPAEISIGKDVFEDISEDAVLYVPKGSLAAFVSDASWNSAFKTISEYGDVSGISTTIVPDTQKTDKFYSLDGKCVGTDYNALGRGIYVVNGKKVLK